jgi:hypothetical protein
VLFRIENQVCEVLEERERRTLMTMGSRFAEPRTPNSGSSNRESIVFCEFCILY